MNTVNVGNGLGELSLFSAALVLAIGLWTGQRQLGFQGMWRVLGTLLAVSVISLLLLPWLWLSGDSRGTIANGPGFSFGVIFASIVSVALNFLPLLVAALQVGAIRDASRSDDSRSPLP
jgi:hypothetical protein